MKEIPKEPDCIRRKTSLGQSLGIPHTFNPDLTLIEAVYAAAIAFSRIFLGSLVFALWGACAWTTYAAVRNPVWGALAMIPIFLLFLGSMAILMIAITKAANWLAGKRKPN